MEFRQFVNFKLLPGERFGENPSYKPELSLLKKISMKRCFSCCWPFFPVRSRLPSPAVVSAPDPEERAARIHQKLDSAFKLDAALMAKVDTALVVLYKKQDARMQEIFSSGERPDRETMMAERQKYTDAQEAILKAVLTEEQFTIWKEKIQPSMRPQRPGGGGDGNRGGGGGGQQ
jgi:hypothetical protein